MRGGLVGIERAPGFPGVPGGGGLVGAPGGCSPVRPVGEQKKAPPGWRGWWSVGD